MIWGVIIFAVVLGLLCLIDDAASNALFSLAVAGNDLAWMMPILTRLVWGQDKFLPGVFYTGRFSKPIAVTAIVYLAFAILLCMFPTTGPDPNCEYIYTIVFWESDANRIHSQGYELHCGHQRGSLARCHCVLHHICAQGLPGAQDDGGGIIATRDDPSTERVMKWKARSR